MPWTILEPCPIQLVAVGEPLGSGFTTWFMYGARCSLSASNRGRTLLSNHGHRLRRSPVLHSASSSSSSGGTRLGAEWPPMSLSTDEHYSNLADLAIP